MYYLQGKQVTLKGSGHKRVIYFFTKTPGKAGLDALPSGFKVKETNRSGLPVLQKAS